MPDLREAAPGPGSPFVEPELAGEPEVNAGAAAVVVAVREAREAVLVGVAAAAAVRARPAGRGVGPPSLLLHEQRASNRAARYLREPEAEP